MKNINYFHIFLSFPNQNKKKNSVFAHEISMSNLCDNKKGHTALFCIFFHLQFRFESTIDEYSTPFPIKKLYLFIIYFVITPKIVFQSPFSILLFTPEVDFKHKKCQIITTIKPENMTFEFRKLVCYSQVMSKEPFPSKPEVDFQGLHFLSSLR